MIKTYEIRMVHSHDSEKELEKYREKLERVLQELIAPQIEVTVIVAEKRHSHETGVIQ